MQVRKTPFVDTPFTLPSSSRYSTELPSAAVSFVDLPEKAPARAPKTFRLMPAW